MPEEISRSVEISHSSDVGAARRMAKVVALEIGFEKRESEEIVLVVSELGTNLIEYAGGGTLTFSPVSDGAREGVQIESLDSGPGIPDPEQAIADGYSTAGSLGVGLGTVNRLMDEFDISSIGGPEQGTHIICRRWLQPKPPRVRSHPLDLGAATRPYPGMRVNGDAFVIWRGHETALTSVIDGLGHGEHAHRASQKARDYVKRHVDQSLPAMFRGVGRACRGTRGVVMSIARFDWRQRQLEFAGVGNIEVRVFGGTDPFHYVIRRGVIGCNAPAPVVTERQWEPESTMVLHSDGLRTSWSWRDISHLVAGSATEMAQGLLRALSRDTDDATVVVVKERAQ